MLRLSWVVAVCVLSLPHPCPAQRILTTIQAAEAEGATYRRTPAPPAVARDFTSPVAGTTERRCVAPPPDSLLGYTLRSGEFILRGQLGRTTGPMGYPLDRARKLMWEPLHNPYAYPTRTGLLVRGVRLGHPTDTLRLVVARAAYPGVKLKYTEAGYPSGFNFRSAGEWLMVATSGSDWGCFLLTIASSPTQESSAAPHAQPAAPRPGDTAFVELRRVTRANRHTADRRGCHFEGAASPLPPGLPPGAVYSERVVSGDPQTCATVVAIGYRLRMPPLDTAGSASHSLSSSINFGDSAGPVRRRKP
jgi:hypothetical protein